MQWRFFYTIISIGNNDCRPPNLLQNQFDYRNQGMRLYRRKIQNQIPGVTIFVLGGEMVNCSFRIEDFASVMQELGIFYLAGKTGQTEMGEGICEHMQVQTASVHALGITAVGRSGELRLSMVQP